MTSSRRRANGCVVALSAILASSVAAQQAPPAPPPASRPADAKPPVKRVRANLSGFDLAPAAPAQSSTQVGGGTRSAPGGPVALAPAIGRCFTATPTFVWMASSGENFEFRLMDETGIVLHRAAVSGRQYVYPADAPPLQPGVTYRWAVQPESTMTGRSSRATVVRVSTPDLDAITRQLAQPAAGVDAAEWRAQVFTDRRLWYDAVAAWSALIDRFPDRADLREKRGQVYDQLQVTQPPADEDFAAAAKLRGASVR